MTRVRTRRGKWTHETSDLRNSVCGIRLRAPIIEPDGPTTCPKCIEILTTN